jgi:ubiquinone biosynthesis protein
MDASRISMARLLSYLFEVTEQFGMETRTELILLQRTMVVVEGVARSLDENINIWSTARPVVEQYITENIGPKAVVRDLVRTAMVLSRFGPRLPQMAQDALLARANTLPPARRSRVGERLGYLAGGVLLAFVSVAVWEFLF